MYQRLLAPIDGSEPARRGFDAAAGLAKALDATLVLLTVVEIYPITTDFGNAVIWETLVEEQRARAQRLLDGAHDAVRSRGIACEAYLEEAASARVCAVIVGQAARHRCDLIVMGTHGRRGGVAGAVIGSDAERVLRTAPCAVLLVRPTATAL